MPNNRELPGFLGSRATRQMLDRAAASPEPGEPDSTIDGKPRRETQQGEKHTMRALIFDDDATVGCVLARIADTTGFVSTLATDKATFRSELQKSLPDVIVLDLQLRDTDGIEELSHLADKGFQGVLILVSGFDSRVLSTAHELASNMGLRVAAAIKKPNDVQALRQVLAGVRQESAPLPPERLVQGIEAGELELEYRPIVACETRSLRKLEALVHWQHPELGRLPPSRFVPQAEANGDVMRALSDWIITTSIRDYNHLRELDIAVPIVLGISPGVLDSGFPNHIDRLLRDSGMAPDQLCLEITETDAFQDPRRIIATLSRIRLKGIQLAIDGFGIGYSSLKLLRQMPFTSIKIDQSFVADITESTASRTIVASIIDLANNMDMETIAEGVETHEAAQLLEVLGADLLQGALIARSMPVTGIATWAARQAVSLRIVAPEHNPPVVPSGATDAVEVAAVSPMAAPGMAHLSPRQQEVMRLLAEGCSIKQVARRLGLGIGTVKTHVSMAYTLLNARTRIEALRRAGLTLTER